jgi:hypothetical protein
MACNELALEYQILDDERHSDGKTPNKRTASVYGLIAPSYGLIAPSNAKAKSIGEWNAGRIVVKGMLVEHWLNGERVITADTGTKEIAEHLKGGGRYLQRQCPIALQHHNEPLWYRSIKIRKLAD